MIDISQRAQEYLRKLLAQQDIDGLGIRIAVSAGGTSSAACDLSFCEPSDLDGNEWTVECQDFSLYVDGASVRWLHEASIDYLPHATGGELNIQAPRIKGEMPARDASMVERVRYVVDAEINPQVAAHGGRITVLEVSSAGEVVLQFGGGCHGCGMVDVTLKQGVEKTLRARVPDITAVRDATDHSSGAHPYYRSRPQPD